MFSVCYQSLKVHYLYLMCGLSLNSTPAGVFGIPSESELCICCCILCTVKLYVCCCIRCTIRVRTLHSLLYSMYSPSLNSVPFGICVIYHQTLISVSVIVLDVLQSCLSTWCVIRITAEWDIRCTSMSKLLILFFGYSVTTKDRIDW